MLSIDEIKLVNQQESNDCTNACLAMLTGYDLDYIKSEFEFYEHSTPVSDSAMLSFLVRNYMLPVDVNQMYGQCFVPNSINLLTVASKYRKNAAHRILVTMTGRGLLKVFDPMDHKGNDYYKLDELIGGRIIICNILRIYNCENGELE